ncbi:MAG: signal peptidase II [Pseudomonadota bacterium]
MARILFVSVSIFVIDQALKFWIVEVMNLKQVLAIDVLPPFLNLRMAWNEGINFGLMSGLEIDAMRWVLITVALVVSVGVLWWGRQFRGWWAALLIGCIVGGALGNTVDRLVYGAVADFLNMSCCGVRNPFSFNVADIAIFVGAIGLVLFSERLPKAPGGGKPRKKKA